MNNLRQVLNSHDLKIKSLKYIGNACIIETDKGKLVYIEGKIRTRHYEDKEGIKRYATEIVAESFTMLGRKTDFEAPSSTGQETKDNHQNREDAESVDFKENDRTGEGDEDEDLPF